MFEEAMASVNRWLGSGPETSDPATKTQGAAAAGEVGTHPLFEAPEMGLWDRIGQGVGDFGRGLAQEGISGLLDPVGLLDRQQAQRDLSDRFQVVADDFIGPRRPNQVSQQEYEDISRTFSNIRRGVGDLTIDTSEMTDDAQEATYRDGAMRNIADIMQTPSGRRQMMQLSDNALLNDAGEVQYDADGDEIHRHTTIRALYNDTNGDGDTTNDGNSSADYFNGNAYEVANGSGGARDASGQRGTGTDTTIFWNPTRRKANGRADISLVHEAQHALHDTQGTTAFGTYNNRGHVDHGLNNYERQAVGLGRSDTPDGSTHYPGDPDGCTENTYRAERNALGDTFVNRDTYR